MKTYKYIYIGLISLAILSISSCQLTEDIDDFEPLFSLSAETGISNESTAELALTGAYSGFNQRSGNSGLPELFQIPSKLSGLAINGFSTISSPEHIGLITNAPIVQGTEASLGAYTRMYDLINRTNWIIEKVPEISDAEFSNPTRKAEIVAEAKALRALGHFYILRLFGQFYDTSSVYGIVVKTAPTRSSEAFPRNTVQETYDQINQDLDDAISDAPDLRARFFTNKTFAKALKAKVQLYMGNYAEAASLAKDVIDNSGGSFSLAPAYDAIFDNTTNILFNSSEVIFGSKGEPGPGGGVGIGNSWGFSAVVNGAYVASVNTGTLTINGQVINYDNNRVASQFVPNQFNEFNCLKYISNPTEQFEMVYHLRMAEVYLIFAEANARANNSVTTDALNALNAVRIRAGATTTGGDGFETYPATITLNEFIEAVRIEKYVELGAEQGEEWFDLVRYHFEDGFDITTVKPTATTPNRYILPIDVVTIEAGGNVVDQNPGY